MRLRFRAAMAALFAAACALSLAACSSGGDDPTIAPTRVPLQTDITVDQDIVYRDAGGTQLAADVCRPAKPTGADPAVLLLHGGGFVEGSHNDEGVQNLCRWLAEEGYVGVAASYRTDPASVYPAQLDDARAAVEWMRGAEQVERFGIDPARIGAIGSSSGGTLAMSLGTFGEGPLDAGSRVGAIVSLSGVSTMTEYAYELGTPTPEATSLMLRYLGCETVTECPASVEASPSSNVDASDSPALLLSSDSELVPQEQSIHLASVLEDAGVTNQSVVIPGNVHGYPLLTGANRSLVLEFLGRHL